MGNVKGSSSCPAPLVPVTSASECITAAETLRPGGGCGCGGPKRQWNDVLIRSVHGGMGDERGASWPYGCIQYAGCQCGCGLYFNRIGYNDSSRVPKDIGDCYGLQVIC